MFRFRLLGVPSVLADRDERGERGGRDAQGGSRGVVELERMPPQQTALLAALALRAGRPVGVPELIDGLFGEQPPASATPMIANYVLRLRKSLGPSLIVRSCGGYLLDVPASSVDALAFVELASACPTGDEHRDAERLRAALDLWRGECALVGLPGPLCGRQRESLAQYRESAQSSWFEHELALGRHSTLLGELSAACQASPFAERLHAARMTALFRCGRPADALQVYQQVRHRLAVELGIDPGAQLTRVHDAVLAGRDPAPARSAALAVTPAAAAPVTTPTAPGASSGGAAPSDSGAWSWQAPRQLPAPTADLTGRSAEVAAISAALTGHPRPVVLVTGTIGVGKSTVAAAAAHAAAPGFPDGRLWAALSAVPPTTAGTGTLLAGFLGALGVPDEHIPTGVADRAALYRTVLAERRVLVVLDDADGTDAAERVAALLPGTPGSAVLLCARSRPLLGVTHWTRLAPLSGADSAELITAIIGPARAAAEPAAVAALASACDGLPLALRGAATRLARRPAWSVASLAARLADRTRLLGELRSTDPGIDSRFERSLGQLVPAQVRALTALAATGRREWTPTAAAALLGLPEEQAEQLLDALVETALLDSPAPGGYVLQELAAAFARRRAADAYTSFATPSVAASAVVSSVASAVAPVMPARAS